MRHPRLKGSVRIGLASRLRGLISAQRLAPGERINESKLSKRLRVSRTPLREALASLEGECLVRSEHDRGFFVPPISVEEFRDLYPIGRELDLLALKSTRHFPESTIRELERLNLLFLRSKRAPDAARRVDEDFHRELIGACPNKRLLKALVPIKAAMERYERLYMSDATDVTRSGAHHARIIAALKAGDIDCAAAALGENWSYGYERLLSMIDERA